MGLLDRLKRALGLGSGGSEAGDGNDRRAGSVRVEHEPDAGTEAVVKGTDDEPAAAGTDAAGSTGSITETPPETPGGDDVAEAAEPAEAAGPVSQTADGEVEPDVDEASDDDVAEATEEAEAAEADETSEGAAADDRPVREISGIGPAYERRLNEAGIETVGELAAADAAELATAADVAEGRVANWIERARGGG